MRLLAVSALLALSVSSCQPSPAFAATGFATYYTLDSCRKEGNRTGRTASGEPYREDRFICALPRRDFGRYYRITSLSTGKSVFAKHTDFGPGRGPRRRKVLVDLSPACFRALGHPLSDGKIPVNVEEACLSGRQAR